MASRPPSLGCQLLCSQPFFLEPVQGRIQRAVSNQQGVARHLLQALRDGIPVDRLKRDHLQNQHVERPL